MTIQPLSPEEWAEIEAEAVANLQGLAASADDPKARAEARAALARHAGWREQQVRDRLAALVAEMRSRGMDVESYERTLRLH